MSHSQLLSRIDACQRTLAVYRPLAGDLLPQVRAWYRVGLVYSSNALEGFTDQHPACAAPGVYRCLGSRAQQ
jgi:hypothetical protein